MQLPGGHRRCRHDPGARQLTAVAIHRPVPTPQDLHRAYALAHDPRRVRRNWVVATVVGDTLGFLVPALVAAAAYDWRPELFLVIMAVAGTVEGIVLGAAQSVVLHREFLGFSRTTWTLVSGLGAGFAWFVGMLPSTAYPVWHDWSWWVLVPLGLVLAALLLASIGLAQWLVLRRHVARSRTWVPVNAAAWLLGLGLMLAVATPLWQEGQSTAVVLAIGAGAGLVMATTVGVVTGWWLGRLVQPRVAATTARPVPIGVPDATWAGLADPTDRYEVFDPLALDDLPEPVQRWLRHAVTPGTPLLTGVDAEWLGHLRLRGTWRTFLARHRATFDRGFVWAARTRVAGLPTTGFDRYTDEQGEMRWRLLRRLPVVSENGEQVARSAAGRHAAEVLAMAPAVALHPSVRWEPVDHQRATAHLVVGGAPQAVTVRVDGVGRLRQVETDRWGRPEGQEFDRYRFGALLNEERAFDGYLVPTELVVGWHIGTGRWEDGIFLRYRVVRCSFH